MLILVVEFHFCTLYDDNSFCILFVETREIKALQEIEDNQNVSTKKCVTLLRTLLPLNHFTLYSWFKSLPLVASTSELFFITKYHTILEKTGPIILLHGHMCSIRSNPVAHVQCVPCRERGCCCSS